VKEIELDLDLAQYIRNIPDFPQPGVQFKDITTLLKEGPAFRETIERLVGLFEDKEIELVVGIEARGFIVGAPLAYSLGCGFCAGKKSREAPCPHSL